jgi:DNA-binding MarR family transcriptional regulator
MNIDTDFIHSFRVKLRVLEREIGRQLKNETTCCGITLAQCHILLELENAGSMSIIDLSRVLELDKSTLSRTVDGLVGSELVERVINPDDRRFMRISLTDKGRASAAAIDKMCNEYYLELFKLIPDGKQAQIIESLMLLGDAMKELKNLGKDCC